MDTKQLRYFLAICEQGSMSKAAESIFISQQALSTSISRLEKELKTSLFIRTSQGVNLTKAGMYFRVQAQKIIDIEDDTTQYLNSYKIVAPNLKLGCAYGAVGQLAEKLFNRRELHSHGIQLKIVEYADIECENAVLNRNVDLGLAIGPINDDFFDKDFLITRRYCFIVHRSHPLACMDEISLDQLRDENIMMMNDKFKANRLLNTLCMRQGFKPHLVYEAGEIAPIRDLVLKQYGIGISTDFIASKFTSPDLKILYVDDPAYSWSVYLIRRKGSAISREASIFRDYLLKESQQSR